MIGSATFGGDGTYRYLLTRSWDDDLPAVVWVMLNPSTATASTNDQTISRVVGFSRSWGYGSAEVVNLFAFRAVDPAALRRADDPVGPANDETVLIRAASADEVIVAWGNHGELANPVTGTPRCDEMSRLLDDIGCKVSCLGVTSRGQPTHPLYLPGDTPPTPIHSMAPP